MKKILTAALEGLLGLVLGLYVLLNPNSFLKYIVLIFSAYLTIVGLRRLAAIFSLRKSKVSLMISRTNAIFAILDIALGVFLIWYAIAKEKEMVSFAASFLVWIFLLDGIFCLVSYFSLKKQLEVSPTYLLIDAAWDIGPALLIALFPRLFGGMLLTILAVLLLAAGVAMLTYACNLYRLRKALILAAAEKTSLDTEFKDLKD